MDEEKYFLSGMKFEDTGFSHTLSVLGGKYKMIILYWLQLQGPVVRFNELKRGIGTISFKTLTTSLRELEADGLIVRKEYPQIPPKVEYSLSQRGQSLLPLLVDLCTWGKNNREEMSEIKVNKNEKLTSTHF